MQALKEIREINAEISGDEIVYKNYYDIGVAVGTDKGLVVPVIRDADQMSFAEIELTLVALGKKHEKVSCKYRKWKVQHLLSQTVVYMVHFFLLR